MSDTAEAVQEFKQLMADPAAREAFVVVKQATGEQARYQHVFQAVFGTPWALYEPYMELVANLLVDRAADIRMNVEDRQARLEAAARAPRGAAPEGVAVIPIHGVITPKASMFSEVSGATAISDVRAAFRSAMADPQVRAVVFDVDSPGGSVEQVPEMAAEIRAARGRKPMVSVANGLMASAAYWLGTQADEVVSTRSGLVGSIGVVTAHKDVSAAAEAKGMKVSMVSAGKFKTEGNPFEPLSDEGRAHIQAMVDEFYGMFVNDVAKARGVGVGAVRGGFGEGRVVSASAAAKEGMVDRIGTLEDTVRGLLRPTGATLTVVGGLGDLAGAGTTTTNTANLGGPLTDEQVPDPEPYDPGDDDDEEEEEDVAVPDGITSAIDNSSWDGNKAMGQCSSAADYRSICAAERSTGEPDERQHWALPHHYLGKGPNEAGVRNALARINQTEGLKNRSAAQSHLDAHMASINPEAAATAKHRDELATRVALLEAPPTPKLP